MFTVSDTIEGFKTTLMIFATQSSMRKLCRSLVRFKNMSRRARCAEGIYMFTVSDTILRGIQDDVDEIRDPEFHDEAMS